jgi:hypothetical protein
MKTLREQRGGAMIFIALFLFAISTVGLTMLAEYTVRNSVRTRDAGKRLQEIYRAITGDQQSGFFGYIGDVGEFPASLLHLVQTPTGAAPAICPSWSCWNGPYLKAASIDSGILLDPYNSPLEFFYLAANPLTTTQERLAIITRGTDNNTSNTASNPNVASQFTAPFPTDAGYPSAAGNADNIVYPDFYTDVDSLNYVNSGRLAYEITNYDANPSVNAAIAACPMMNTLQITSTARGAADTLVLPYSPGVSTDLWQGDYTVRITSPLALSSYVEEQVQILPGGATTTRQLRANLINSSTTPTYTLTVTNNLGFSIRIRKFGNNVGTVASGATADMGVHEACSNMTAEQQSPPGPALDSWVMPVMAYTRVVAPVASTLTVNNLGSAHHQIRVLVNGILVGSVVKRSGRSFASVPAAMTVTITDQAGTTIQTLVMPAGPQTVNVP